jgi:hypothetical protein
MLDVQLATETEYCSSYPHTSTTDAHTLLRDPESHPRFLAGTLRILHVDLVLAINIAIREQALEDTATVRTAHGSSEVRMFCYRSRRAAGSVETWPIVGVVARVTNQLRYWL